MAKEPFGTIDDLARSQEEVLSSEEPPEFVLAGYENGRRIYGTPFPLGGQYSLERVDPSEDHEEPQEAAAPERAPLLLWPAFGW